MKAICQELSMSLIAIAQIKNLWDRFSAGDYHELAVKHPEITDILETALEAEASEVVKIIKESRKKPTAAETKANPKGIVPTRGGGK